MGSRANLLLPEPVPNRRSQPSSIKKCSRYFTRLLRFNQMDFEFATWQMVYLFTAPQKVFKNSVYRKQTKNQYARDDPAFLVILAAGIILSAAGLSIVLRLNILSFIKFVFWLVLVDCVMIGAVVATLAWILTNKFLKKDALSSEDVEWGYAFDVHLNAFFPPLIILHLFQLFFFSYFISQDWFLSRLFGNTLWLVAVIYYCYITYLGYRSLPYLKDTKFILYALVPTFLVYIVSILAGINIMRMIMNFYEYRVS